MADAISIQELIDARTDAKTLEEAVNGDAVTTVLSRLGETYPTLSNALNQIDSKLDSADAQVKQGITNLFENGGLPATPFTTKALMTASALVDGDYAYVTDDSVTDNNGLYVKTSGAWVKSKYDPYEFILSFLGHDAGSSDIFVIKDVNKTITVRQDVNGDIHLPSIGNLTEALSNMAESQIPVDFLESERVSAKYADYAASQATGDFSKIDYLLKASDIDTESVVSHPVGLLRIPAITRIEKNKYLLFFEAREGLDDFGRNSQCVATIDVDLSTKTATVSGVKALHESFTDTDGKLRTFMNACAVKLDSGKIITMYVRRHQTTEHDLYMRTSTDNGITWSNFTDLSAVKNAQGLNVLAACSQGLVKRYGNNKGRVVFPVWTTGEAYNVYKFRAGYIYSDDDGQTWQLAPFINSPTANEVQVAEDINGDLIFAVRHEDTSFGAKALFRCSDKDGSYTKIETNIKLTSAPIMSGFIQGKNKYDLTPPKLQMSVCKNINRTTLDVHTSYDGGETWRTHTVPETINQGVAYTCIENIDAGFKLLVWESDTTKNFKYAVTSNKNLIEGGL